MRAMERAGAGAEEWPARSGAGAAAQPKGGAREPDWLLRWRGAPGLGRGKGRPSAEPAAMWSPRAKEADAGELGPLRRLGGEGVGRSKAMWSSQ